MWNAAAAGPFVAVKSLTEAVDWILERESTHAKLVEELDVKIFADGADLGGMLEMYAKPYIKGFTTNPTLMRKAGLRTIEVLRALC